MIRAHRLMIALACVLAANYAIAENILFTNATVHTMGPSGTLENASVLVRDGRFAAVGNSIDDDIDAEVVDATGKIITPGFFSAMGQLGLTEVSAVDGSVDFQQAGQHYTASFTVADAYNHRSVLVATNRAGGITRALTAPAAGYGDGVDASAVFSGLAAVVQLGDQPGFIAAPNAAMVVNLGESGGELAGGSRAIALMTLRTALNDAIDYRRNKDAFERGQRRPYSISREDLEALQPVVGGRVPLLVSVNRATDIETLVQLGRDYNLKLIVYGGAEAWMVAELLARHNVSVILDAKGNLPMSFDALNARLESAAILVAAGVEISFGGDWQSETYAARNISQSAGNAVANGLAWIDALAAITIAPARMYGLDDQVGSIEAGKEADMIVWSADPLELSSNPDEVLIRGQRVSLENRQTLLRDRYLQTDSEKPPAFRN